MNLLRLCTNESYLSVFNLTQSCWSQSMRALYSPRNFSLSLSKVSPTSDQVSTQDPPGVGCTE